MTDHAPYGTSDMIRAVDQGGTPLVGETLPFAIRESVPTRICPSLAQLQCCRTTVCYDAHGRNPARKKLLLSFRITRAHHVTTNIVHVSGAELPAVLFAASIQLRTESARESNLRMQQRLSQRQVELAALTATVQILQQTAGRPQGQQQPPEQGTGPQFQNAATVRQKVAVSDMVLTSTQSCSFECCFSDVGYRYEIRTLLVPVRETVVDLILILRLPR